MIKQNAIDYKRIAQAIEYIVAHHQNRPSLEEIAAAVHLSPYHFQRLFSQWAGVSPKKFMQYLCLDHARKALLDGEKPLFEIAWDAGLSGSGRLHDLFVHIEAMTPGQFRARGAGLEICCSFAETPFGTVLIASTARGACHIAFEDNPEQGQVNLQAKFPKASFRQECTGMHQQVSEVLQSGFSASSRIRLHLAGTPFQLKVWEALLRIPQGRLASYGQIAETLGQPSACRAVGTAIGRNPIAFLIPCHRVIRQTGEMSGYMWGIPRKQAIIAWEGAQSIKI